jgi:HopA1 effector protein family
MKFLVSLMSPQILSRLLTQLTPDWAESPWIKLSHLSLPLRRQISIDWLEHWILDYAIDWKDRETIDLSNEKNYGLNINFTHYLHAANQGQGYWDPNWQIEQILSPDAMQVEQDGLHLKIQIKQHLSPSQQHSQPGDTVMVKMPRNRIEADRYVAIGDAGIPIGPQIAVFFHLNAEGAAVLMQAATSYFNQAEIPFRLDLPYRLEHYPVKNAGMLQISAVHRELADRFIQECYAEIQPYLQPGEPLLSEMIRPGVGMMPIGDHPGDVLPLYRELAAMVFDTCIAPKTAIR